MKSKLKILFINADVADYQHISLLHGLKCFENIEVIDFPKAEILYKPYREDLQMKIRGQGFSMFFLHEDQPVRRFNIQFEDIAKQEYDLIVFGDIHNGFGYLLQFYPYLDSKKTAILDGSDSPAIFPYNGNYWRKPYYWFLPRPHKRFKYFKREITPETVQYLNYKIPFTKYLSSRLPKNVIPLPFSIPEEKIVPFPPPKRKDFPRHIVDPEIAQKIYGSSTAYAFGKEEEYYQDLQDSKFGITTKRGGWDCLRHYEIAANGAVICFRQLNKKPDSCSPLGLVPGKNCISYNDYNDLMSQTTRLNDDAYHKIQTASLAWVRENSTVSRARNFLKTFNL